MMELKDGTAGAISLLRQIIFLPWLLLPLPLVGWTSGRP